MHGMILRSGMITSSPLVSPLCFIAQWAASDLTADLPNHGRNRLPLSAETPFPPTLRSSSLSTVPVPTAQAATASFICAYQPFLCLFTLPSRSRAASCNIFCATGILTSASSNLCLWWAFSTSRLSADYISSFAPVPHASSDPTESLLYCLVILGFPVLRSQDLQAI